MHLLRSLRYGMPGGGRHSFGASADQPDEIRHGEIVLISIPLLIPTFSKERNRGRFRSFCIKKGAVALK